MGSISNFSIVKCAMQIYLAMVHVAKIHTKMTIVPQSRALNSCLRNARLRIYPEQYAQQLNNRDFVSNLRVYLQTLSATAIPASLAARAVWCLQQSRAPAPPIDRAFSVQVMLIANTRYNISCCV